MFDVLLMIVQGSGFIRDIVEAVHAAVTCTTTEYFDPGNAIHSFGVDVCVARGV